MAAVAAPDAPEAAAVAPAVAPDAPAKAASKAAFVCNASLASLAAILREPPSSGHGHVAVLVHIGLPAVPAVPAADSCPSQPLAQSPQQQPQQPPAPAPASCAAASLLPTPSSPLSPLSPLSADLLPRSDGSPGTATLATTTSGSQVDVDAIRDVTATSASTPTPAPAPAPPAALILVVPLASDKSESIAAFKHAFSASPTHRLARLVVLDRETMSFPFLASPLHTPLRFIVLADRDQLRLTIDEAVRSFSPSEARVLVAPHGQTDTLEPRLLSALAVDLKCALVVAREPAVRPPADGSRPPAIQPLTPDAARPIVRLPSMPAGYAVCTLSETHVEKTLILRDSPLCTTKPDLLSTRLKYLTQLQQHLPNTPPTDFAPQAHHQPPPNPPNQSLLQVHSFVPSSHSQVCSSSASILGYPAAGTTAATAMGMSAASAAEPPFGTSLSMPMGGTGTPHAAGAMTWESGSSLCDDHQPGIIVSVGNIPDDVSADELRMFFKAINLLRIRISSHRTDKRPLALIEVADTDGLEEVLRMNGQRLRGVRIKIDYDPTRFTRRVFDMRLPPPADRAGGSVPVSVSASVSASLPVSAGPAHPAQPSAMGGGGPIGANKLSTRRSAPALGQSVSQSASAGEPSQAADADAQQQQPTQPLQPPQPKARAASIPNLAAPSRSWNSPPRRASERFSSGASWEKKGTGGAEPQGLGWHHRGPAAFMGSAAAAAEHDPSASMSTLALSSRVLTSAWLPGPISGTVSDAWSASAVPSSASASASASASSAVLGGDASGLWSSQPRPHRQTTSPTVLTRDPSLAPRHSFPQLRPDRSSSTYSSPTRAAHHPPPAQYPLSSWDPYTAASVAAAGRLQVQPYHTDLSIAAQPFDVDGGRSNPVTPTAQAVNTAAPAFVPAHDDPFSDAWITQSRPAAAAASTAAAAAAALTTHPAHASLGLGLGLGLGQSSYGSTDVWADGGHRMGGGGAVDAKLAHRHSYAGLSESQYLYNQYAVQQQQHQHQQMQMQMHPMNTMQLYDDPYLAAAGGMAGHSLSLGRQPHWNSGHGHV